jgi:hypothetical protein
MLDDYTKIQLPVEFNFPMEFRKIIELNIVNIEPWYIMNAERIETRINGLKEKYPSRCLIPFAKRDDNDDVACFELGQDKKVFIVHDYASPGWEQHKIFEDFWSWFRKAIEDMIEF